MRVILFQSLLLILHLINQLVKFTENTIHRKLVAGAGLLISVFSFFFSVVVCVDVGKVWTSAPLNYTSHRPDAQISVSVESGRFPSRVILTN